MACAQNLKLALIIFWVNRWQIVGFLITVQNLRQFVLVQVQVKLTFFLKNLQFACLINDLPNLHMLAICKLGKGTN
jgi:hypothetical protein